VSPFGLGPTDAVRRRRGAEPWMLLCLTDPSHVGGPGAAPALL